MSQSDESRAPANRGRRRRGPRKPRPDDAGSTQPTQRKSRPPRSGPRADSGLARRAQARHNAIVPPIVYPENLPVSARRADISDAIRDNQVVIVAGATGSGKTTQIPKIALELGRGRDGQIGHTQPRRIAARTVADRIAEEINAEHTDSAGVTRRGKLGGIVGYQVRFTDESSESTLIKVMTDGILLAQIQRDPQLRAYDTLIIDEAHERSLNIDFILGYLTQLLPQRPDLKVIITSATIDSTRFAEHFADADGEPAPVIEVTGRTFPVEIRYSPLVPDSDLPEAEDEFAGYDDAPSPTASAPSTKPAKAAKAAKSVKSAQSGKSGGKTGGGKGKQAPKNPKKQAKEPTERDVMTAICEAADELFSAGPGDILVFLSGEREIRDAEDALRGHFGPLVDGRGTPSSIEIVPLYARLSSAEQHRVFQSHGGLRIVLATNVAETSLTVPGIRYVIDPGTARISRFSKATKVQRLPIEPISQASANQRSGRCGRVADGIAIRLYSEADFMSRPEFTEPEILRTSLASVILQMISAGVAAGPDDVAQFPFVEPPDVRAIRDGVQLLTELGAIETVAATPDRNAPEQAAQSADPAQSKQLAQPGKPAYTTRLTDVGQAIAQLPMDPRLARMIVAGSRHGVGREVMIITAVLSIQDPRERPMEHRATADQLHARFTDPTSDFLTYLNLWEYLNDQRSQMGSSAFRRLCRSEHINFLRVREWQDVFAQLREMAKGLGLAVNSPTSRALVKDGAPSGIVRRGASGARALSAAEAAAEARERESTAPEQINHKLTWDADTLHRSLLAGLLSHIGMQQATEVKAVAGRQTGADRRAARHARNEYIGARNAQFAIFPGSGLAKKPPAWIMAGELVETSRLWARDAARIQPEWAEELAAHLVKYVYSEPHWSTKQGAAQAYESALLYGLPIVTRRRVLYGKVEPEIAREMFIRHALVQGEWTTHHKFFQANRALLEEAEALEARARRRDLMVDDDVLFTFYDERVPADVVSARHFDTWWKSARREDPDQLTFTAELLVPQGADDVDTTNFPDTWEQGDLRLPLTYQFVPGQDSDGVTVHVPIAVLDRVRPDGFDWLVPGMFEELTVAWIRALPKPIRVQLVPAPDVAAEIVAWLRANEPAWTDITRAGDMAPSFTESFTRAARALRDVDIPPNAWDDSKLPPHLRVSFRVTDDRGVILDEGLDLVVLQRRLAAQSQAAVRSVVRSAVGQAMREAQAAVEVEQSGASDPSTATGADGTTAGPDGTGTASGVSAAAGAGESGADRAAQGFEDEARAELPVAEQTGLTTWPELTDAAGTRLPGDALPLEVATPVGSGASAMTVRGYPALVIELGPSGGNKASATPPAAAQTSGKPAKPTKSGKKKNPGAPARNMPSVALRVLADQRRQHSEHERGVRKLILNEVGLATARVTSRWSGTQSLTLAASPYRNTEALVGDIQVAAVADLTSGKEPGVPAAADVRDGATYADLRTGVRQRIEERVHQTVGHVTAALTAARDLDVQVREANSLALLNTLTDLRDHAAGLIYDGFISNTPPDRLRHLTRYLRADLYRLEKATSNPNRDAELAWRVRDVEDGYDRAKAAYADGKSDADRAAELAQVHWMLEEFRVSLFAQQLGTDGPISEKRIRNILGGW